MMWIHFLIISTTPLPYHTTPLPYHTTPLSYHLPLPFHIIHPSPSISSTTPLSYHPPLPLHIIHHSPSISSTTPLPYHPPLPHPIRKERQRIKLQRLAAKDSYQFVLQGMDILFTKQEMTASLLFNPFTAELSELRQI